MRRIPSVVLVCLCVCLLAIALIRAGGQQAIPAETLRQDYYGFNLDKMKLDYQQEVNTIRLSVLYRYPADLPAEKYPDVNQVRNDLLNDIKSYPNKTDYWEVWSSNLANHLFSKYNKEMEALRIKLEIAPTHNEPFDRTSLVTRARPGSAPIIP